MSSKGGRQVNLSGDHEAASLHLTRVAKPSVLVGCSLGIPFTGMEGSRPKGRNGQRQSEGNSVPGSESERHADTMAVREY